MNQIRPRRMSVPNPGTRTRGRLRPISVNSWSTISVVVATSLPSMLASLARRPREVLIDELLHDPGHLGAFIDRPMQ